MKQTIQRSRIPFWAVGYAAFLAAMILMALFIYQLGAGGAVGIVVGLGSGFAAALGLTALAVGLQVYQSPSREPGTALLGAVNARDLQLAEESVRRQKALTDPALRKVRPRVGLGGGAMAVPAH